MHKTASLLAILSVPSSSLLYVGNWLHPQRLDRIDIHVFTVYCVICWQTLSLWYRKKKKNKTVLQDSIAHPQLSHNCTCSSVRWFIVQYFCTSWRFCLSNHRFFTSQQTSSFFNAVQKESFETSIQPLWASAVMSWHAASDDPTLGAFPFIPTGQETHQFKTYLH